jgi:hypothetical protein
MPSPQRTWFTLVGVIATGLTVLGIVLAATDSNPADIPKDSLALNGYPPKTAELAVTVTTGDAISVHAIVNVNFQTNKIEANFEVPLLLSGVPIDLRIIGDDAYASTPNFTATVGKPWIRLKERLPQLFNYSLEFVHPDISLISGFSHETVTKSGYYVTHDFSRDNVALKDLGASSTSLVKVGTLNWSITTGKQGEVTASTVTVSTKHQSTTIHASVVAYNHRVNVVRPSADEVKTESSSYLKGLLGSGALSVLVPANLSNLGTTSLS